MSTSTNNVYKSVPEADSLNSTLNCNKENRTLLDLKDSFARFNAIMSQKTGKILLSQKTAGSSQSGNSNNHSRKATEVFKGLREKECDKTL